MKKFLQVTLVFLLPFGAFAQTLSDGLMMPKNYFCTGFVYTSEKWTQYWEGELKRDNGNIGSVRTQALTWMGNYGISEKLNIIAMLPYVKTEASAGTMMGMEGLQDASLAVKYRFLRKDFGESSFRTFAVVNVSTPVSDYTPDYFPLSIGTKTTNIMYRLTGYYKITKMIYVNLSAGYTWRSNTTLDRPAYFTKDQLFLTNEAQMPNVFDYFFSAGILKNGLQAELQFMQQNTLGGSDIRRQDMPFVSNRMNMMRAGGLVMYYLPKPKGLALRGAYTMTLAGRNVGESTTLLAGLLYTIDFNKSKASTTAE